MLLVTLKEMCTTLQREIVGVALGCNNFKVKDIGVIQQWVNIRTAIEESQPDVIGMSGLITPSLES